MARDPALVSFTDRGFNANDGVVPSSTELLFWKSLEIVSDNFNKATNLPFEDRYQKAGSGFIQLHAPAPDIESMQSWALNWQPPEWRGFYPAEEGLGNWLVEHAAQLAEQFVEAAKTYNVDRLFRMELPQGVRGAFWRAPFRLAWCYNINEDNYIARFDLIGSIATNCG